MAEKMTDEGRALIERSLGAFNVPSNPSVITAIVGFVTLLALAYLAGHARVRRLERRLRIAHFVAAGLPFVLLGYVASRPTVGILTPAALEEIRPLFALGLGWIGFVIGSRFEARRLEHLPSGTAMGVVVTTAVPLIAIFGLCAVLLFGGQTLLGAPGGDGAFRDAVLLAVAGAMAARSSPHFLRSFSPGEPISQRLVRIMELEQLAGVAGMMMVSAFFRPQGGEVAWQLPGTAWLFVTCGIGTIMGIVVFAALTKLNQGPQFTAALLGGVAFTAGMASYLRLSSISVCFIAGAIVINLGGPWREQARAILERLERPIYFIFLVIAGALWHPWELQGWVLMALFIAGRFVSKWLAAVALDKILLKDLVASERRALTIAPMGALSVAIVVSAQDLYSGPTVGWIVTAVIGGSIVMELALQVLARRAARGAAAPYGPQPTVETAGD
jgi:hypothetical protein